MRRAALITAVLAASLAGDALPAASPASTMGKVMIYVGTYTSGESKGIYRLRLDLATGALSPAGEPAEAVNPSFLALHPSGRFLYAVNETGEGPDDPSGGVSAFAVDAATGALTFLNRQESGGAAPCHVTIAADGRHALVANYAGGTVSVLPIGKDGRLGKATAVVRHSGRGVKPQQGSPHPHSVNLDAANRYALVADLGIDEVISYRFDAARGLMERQAEGTLTLPAGAGPRHLAFHPSGRQAYVIDELDSTVTRLDYDPASGAVTAKQRISTLPEGYAGRNSTAEVAAHPDGKLLFGSNRGHDSIAIFTVDATTGALLAAGHQPTGGKNPRHFAIDPTGAYLLAANQDSDTIAVFRIDRATGRLHPVGSPARVPKPVCLRMALP